MLKKFSRASIVGKEVLPPPELEKVFGLTGGTTLHLPIFIEDKAQDLTGLLKYENIYDTSVYCIYYNILYMYNN